ncbi:hypothetical protein [Bradyrhizobium lablabi]|uniref:hypothetical protein n=1 Tax=Bradyrhizobium lablabi TaxID=722472 RepID=UPI001BAA8111|nr:hypothetical protein [Bradyrhizobium lablabi]MBR0693680.1 hypothetical protein [Bradyrhizobium lablabi]
MMELKEFEAMLSRSLATVEPKLAIGLDKVGQLAESIAAELPGHYQPGWAPLAESTIKDKVAKGFPVPSPLKRTGAMAGSYRKEVDPASLAMVVGSADPKALWQEMGTSRGIPPRPVCEPALKRSLPFAADVFGAIAVSLLTGKALLK